MRRAAPAKRASAAGDRTRENNLRLGYNPSGMAGEFRTKAVYQAPEIAV
jgi:hypothetical protein